MTKPIVTQGVRPIGNIVASRCACSPYNFCLLHFAGLTDREQATVRRQVGVR